MDKLELVKRAWTQLGEAAAETLSAFIEQAFGVRINPCFIPIYKATLLDRLGRQAKRSARPLARASSRTLIIPETPQCEMVRQQAQDLMLTHGLADWQFRFNRRKCSMGLCVYGRHTIELSVHLVERNGADEILDTILHEIAHALVGPRHGHNRVWKRKAIEIGARPQRCGQADMPAGAWQAHCPTCGQLYNRHRKPKRMRGWHCPRCGSERGKLYWRNTG